MSATISASLVKELRDATGAGMMDCKRALEETGGDIDAAASSCARRAWRSAAKRAGRETTEGKVGYRIADDGPGHDGRRRLRDRAGLEQRGVPRLRQEGARARRRGRRRARPTSSRTSASSSSAKLGENIVVARRRTLRGRRRRATSTATSTRRRTRSACSCSVRGGNAELAPQAGDAHRARRARAGSPATRCPADCVDAEREIYCELGRGAVQAGAGAREDRRGHAQQAVLRARRCCSTRRGSTTPRRRSAQALDGGGRRGARVRALRARRSERVERAAATRAAEAARRSAASC